MRYRRRPPARSSSIATNAAVRPEKASRRHRTTEDDINDTNNNVHSNFILQWMDYCGGGYGEHTDSCGFLFQSSWSSYATESSSSPKSRWNYTTVHQQPTIFQRELTKLLIYELSNAVLAKMFAARFVRRVSTELHAAS
jgi:hypothetical protein